MQLVAYGAQDIYLTGNPQITFFKVVYRRHTNFSMEAIQQTVNGTQQVTTAGGQSGTVTISRNGDLVHKVYVHIDDANVVATGDGNDIVREVELEIGGQKIDKHTNEYMKVMNELSTPESKAIGLKALTGGIGTWGAAGATGVNVCMVPLQFWFCRNPGLALPLIALQYHEVKLKFTWGALVTAASATCNVFCDYIYLDTDERRRFAQQSHEYLIEQVQTQSEGTAARSYKLNFNHPVKELVWTSNVASGQPAKLSLNGHDRFSFQPEEYFQLRQPLDHHTAVPRQNLPTSARVGNARVSVAGDLVTPANTGANVLLDNVSLAAGTLAGAIDGNDVLNISTAAGVTTLAICNTGTALAFVNGVTARTTAFNVGDTLALVVTTTANSGTANGNTTGVSLNGAAEAAGADLVPGFPSALTTGRVFFGTVTNITQAAGGNAANNVNIAFASGIVSSTGDSLTAFAAAPAGGGATAVTGRLRLFLVNNAVLSQARTSSLTEKINVYSFALKPEEHQPSGTCNFSRIDTAKLEFSGDPVANGQPQNIYAVNYNVLRIMSGMGGLAYSN